jgi:hypothetical protein
MALNKNQLATGGVDFALRFYDLNSQPCKVTQTFQHSHEEEPAHFNRICSIKYDP